MKFLIVILSILITSPTFGSTLTDLQNQYETLKRDAPACGITVPTFSLATEDDVTKNAAQYRVFKTRIIASKKALLKKLNDVTSTVLAKSGNITSTAMLFPKSDLLKDNFTSLEEDFYTAVPQGTLQTPCPKVNNLFTTTKCNMISYNINNDTHATVVKDLITRYLEMEKSCISEETQMETDKQECLTIWKSKNLLK